MPFKVTAIIAAYNEADIVGAVIRDLIEQGVEVHLIDHSSTDDTVAEARPFLGKGLRAIERFPEDAGAPAEDASHYAWTRILDRKAALAQSLESDWFIHADADELRESPWQHLRLREAIELVDRMGYNAIDFAVLNFRPINDNYRRGDDLRQAFTHYEPSRAFDAKQIKAWKKQPAKVDLSWDGGHQVAFPGLRVFPLRFLLRHYPIRTQAQGRRKVELERRPRLLPEERARRWHVQYDEVVAGDSFIHDEKTLLRYDADEVRANLALRHRDVEALEARIDGLSLELAETSEALRLHKIDLAAVRGELARAETQLEASCAELRGVAGELGRAEEQLASAHEGLRANIAELGEIRRSRTWRFTEAARAAWRLWGRR
jgi:glycosyltransferase involved in cell wall biosynthesis